MVTKGKIAKIESERNLSAKREAKAIRLFSVFAVLIMTVSVLCVLTVEHEEADADTSEYNQTHLWKCVLTAGSNGSIGVQYYTRENTSSSWASISTTPVTGSGARNGSAWYYNPDTGYGPFNSFYAAFTTGGTMVCHLNPYNLARNIDATDTQNYANGSYNIMWVLPLFYADTSNSTMVFTNDSTVSEIQRTKLLSTKTYANVYDAFYCNGTTYNYIAYGVYEATGTSKLGSASGQTPTTSKTVKEFRTLANNSTSGDISVSQLMNFYQWQAYRFCSLAAMGTKDSQAQVGSGNTTSGVISTTGALNGSGPYAGSSSTTSSVKLFIENMWGSAWEFLDDTQFKDGKVRAGTHAYSEITKYYGTSKNSEVWSFSMTDKALNYPYGSGTSTSYNSWGLPTGSSETSSSDAPDWIVPNGFYIFMVGTYSPGEVLYVGGYANGGDHSGLSAIYTDSDTKEESKSGTAIGARLVFMFNTDRMELKTLTISKNTGVTLNVSVGGTTTSQTSFYIIKGNKVVVDSNEDSSTYGVKLTFTNSSGKSVVVTATASDGYRLLGWYKDSNTERTKTGITMNDSHTMTLKTQLASILTVATDGGASLREKIGDANESSISDGQSYLITKGADAISVSGNSLTFSGNKQMKGAVATISTITVTGSATTVANGGSLDYRILGWNEDNGTAVIGATKNSDGSFATDKISLSNVSSKTLTLDTQQTVALSVQEITGATLTLISGNSETIISPEQIFTLDMVGSKYPTVSVAGNALTFTGYIGLPGDDIISMSSITILAKADLKADGKDADYRLVGWYIGGNLVEGTSEQPKIAEVNGTTGTVKDGDNVTTKATTAKMEVKETKTFYVDSKYGGSLSANIALSDSSSYMFTVDVDSSVVIGNGSNGFGLGEIGFKGYYGAVPSTKVTGVSLEDVKFTAVAGGDYRFWIWSSAHVADENASSDSSQSYDDGKHLYARFAAQVSSSSVLQTAADNSVGLIEVIGDVSIDQLTLTKDADNLGGPYAVLKPGTTTTVVSSLTVGADTAITIQSEGSAPMTLSASAEEPEALDITVAKLVSNGSMSVSGKVTNNGVLSKSVEKISIDAGGLVTNNNELDFASGATYTLNGGTFVNNGTISYTVATYDQLVDAVGKAVRTTKITVVGDDVAVTGSIDIPGNDAVISMYIPKDSSMTIAASGAVNFKDSCNLTVNGTLTNSGAVSIQGTVDPSDEESATKSGYVTVNGTIDNIGGTFTIDANGTLKISSQAIFHVDKKSTYEQKTGGVLENDGTIVFDVDSQSRLLEYMEKADANTRVDIVKADDGKRFDISQAITIPSATNPDVTLEVVFTSGTESAITSGGLTIADNGTVTVAGKLTNRGTITTIGSSENGGLLKVTGELVNTGRLVGDNNGRITVSGYQDNQAGTLTLKNGTSLTIETSGKVHVDIDSEYEKSDRGALNNYGLLIIDVNTEEGLNEAIEKAQEVINLGAGQVRIDIVEDMKIRGRVDVPNGVNLVVTENTTTTIRPNGSIYVQDGGTLTVDGKLIVEYGGKLKIEDGGTLINNGRIIRISEDGDEEEFEAGKDMSNQGNTLAVAFGAAAVASLFALTMFMDQYKDTATVTFYSSRGGRASRSVVRVPNGTEMMIKGRNAIFYIEGKELPQIITAEPEKGHRFDVWNLYDQDDGSWYPSKGHSMYGDEKSFFVVGNVEVDVMFAEGENDGVRAIGFESRVKVTKGFRDPKTLTEKHEDRIQNLD